MESFLDNLSSYLIDTALVIVSIPVNVSEKFFYLYLLTFVALAYFSYRRYYRKDTTDSQPESMERSNMS